MRVGKQEDMAQKKKTGEVPDISQRGQRIGRLEPGRTLKDAFAPNWSSSPTACSLIKDAVMVTHLPLNELRVAMWVGASCSSFSSCSCSTLFRPKTSSGVCLFVWLRLFTCSHAKLRPKPRLFSWCWNLLQLLSVAKGFPPSLPSPAAQQPALLHLIKIHFKIFDLIPPLFGKLVTAHALCVSRV